MFSLARRVATSAKSSSRRLSSSLGYFPGTEMPFVPDVVFRDPRDDDPIPCFRSTSEDATLRSCPNSNATLLLTAAVLNEDGDVVEGATDPQLSQSLCTQIYSQMIRLNVRIARSFREKSTLTFRG